MTEDSKCYKPASVNPIHRRASHIISKTASFEERFVPDHGELVDLINHLRSVGCIIVFTTGTWDMHHNGHTRYMKKGKEEAHALYPDADHIILVVGVDTDALTQERKGPTRPIVKEQERYEVIESLRVVDIVTPQYEANQLYTLFEYDVRIISKTTGDLPKDYEMMKRMCAHLVELESQSETSTSARIRTLVLDGGLAALDKMKSRLTKLKSLIDEVFQEVHDEVSR